jgi:tetratricopeptide (TPR) repeat protein
MNAAKLRENRRISLSTSSGKGLRLRAARITGYFQSLRSRGGILIGVVALAFFFRVGGFGFLTWDRELVQSPSQIGLSATGVLNAFTQPAPWDGIIGPLADVSHMIDFQLFRFDAWSHHLTNVWLHVFNVLLVFAIARRLTASAGVAFVVTTVFALHPLQAGPVVWVSQRRILLETVMILGAFRCWLFFRETEQPIWYALTLVSAFLSAMCYPAMAIVLFFIPLFDRRVATGKTRKGSVSAKAEPGWPTAQLGVFRHPFLAHAPIWIAVFASFIWVAFKRIPPLGSLDFRSVAETSAQHVVDIFSSFPKVAFAMVSVQPLCPIAHLDGGNASMADASMAGIGVVVLLFAWLFRAEIGYFVLAGLAWFICVGLITAFASPESAFAQVQWIYLANVGLAFALACAVERLWQAKAYARLANACVALFLFIMAFYGSREISVWSSNDRVAGRIFASGHSGWQPWRAWQCLGAEQIDFRNDPQAINRFRHALACEFDSRTLAAIGFIEKRRGCYRQARLLFGEVVRSKDRPALGHTALGTMDFDAGNFRSAAAELSAALKTNPKDVEALARLAMIRAAAPTPELRDGGESVALAARASRLSKGSWTYAISAGAAAHAEAGDFRLAQALAKTALFWTVRLGDTNEIANCEERLENFKAGKPWRMSTLQTNSPAPLPGDQSASR